MNNNERKDLQEILSLNPAIPADLEVIEREYIPVDMDKVDIDGNTFTNYGQYSFIWEKTYAKSPQRSTGGAMGSLNSLATYLTPRLVMDFSVMSIDDYRAIMRLHYSKNEFLVSCYDQIYNQRISVKMYFATEQIAKLHTIHRKRMKADGSWEDFLMLAGVREYSVELIGTNNPLDTISVFYHYVYPNSHPTDKNGNPLYPAGIPISPEAEGDLYSGDYVVLGGNSTFQSRPPTPNYRFKEWVDDNGTTFRDGDEIQVLENTNFYAVWKTTTEYQLAFNYGIAEPVVDIDPETSIATPRYSKRVAVDGKIGELPEPADPYVEDEKTNERYYPYENGAWYYCPVISEKFKVSPDDVYSQSRDTTIYRLYEKKLFNVNYVSGVEGANIPQTKAPFGEKVYTPTLYREGYTFQGWYQDEEFTRPFNGTMPPHDITIYAKWEKVKQ
jgi:uncharacterized repeat protein (TIGR02543 family)